MLETYQICKFLTGFGGSGIIRLADGLNSNNSFGNGIGRRIFKGLLGVPEHKPGYSLEQEVPEGQDEQGGGQSLALRVAVGRGLRLGYSAQRLRPLFREAMLITD